MGNNPSDGGKNEEANNKKRRNKSLVRFLQSSQEQVVITDINGKILFVNDDLLKVTQYSLDEVMGKTPAIWGGQMEDEFYEFIWDKIKKEKQSISTIVTNRKKDGDTYDAHLHITPVVNPSREIEFFVGIEKVF